ncbi:MAG: hypothetical protein GTN80_08175 [Nitrososphaeria archaeon]|nr:hypothetical protein [Nitrososphaeria archaeon]NIQ33599.1 hypothetical protein [Nitrososphaeria archaeon]
MATVKEQVMQLLDQFAQEEMGNRLSQFAMMSLRGMMGNVLDQHLDGVEKQMAALEKRVKESKEDGKKKDEANA